MYSFSGVPRRFSSVFAHLGRKLSYSDYINNAQAITFWANHRDEHWGRVSALQERLKVVLTS